MKMLKRIVLLGTVGCVATSLALAQQMEAPASITAGSELHVHTSGQGSAVLYVIGPGSVVKRKVELGTDIAIPAEQVEQAGRYVAILRAAGGSTDHAFWVTPSAPADIAFLARPSRVPVAVPGAVSGVAYIFDAYQNLVTKPVPVQFELSVSGASKLTNTVASKDGVAWMRADSGRREGAAQFVASTGEVSEKRVVQFVASEPCNLHIQAARVKEGIEIKTEPVRDCSGNPVPDGTIVTFTAVTDKGRSSVDARIRHDVASTTLPLEDAALISVASGVVMGNEVRVGGAR
jgi:hypothetical protein